MKWIVGLDLRKDCEGPVRFASWLARHLTGDSFHGLHVIEQESLQFIVALQGMPGLEGSMPLDHNGLVQAAQARVDALLAETGATALAGARADVSATAELRLAAAVDATPGSGLIIGRRAKAGEDRFVRLGRVARHLLRSLPGPIIATPPDLALEAIGDGPIILGTDTREDAVAAGHFAAGLAAQLKRPLLAARIAPMPEHWAHEFVATSMLPAIRAQLEGDSRQRLGAWLREHGLAEVATHVALGDVAACLGELAEQQRAPLIVVGSRKLGPLTRLFVASVASELAATARCAVAVVPPDYHPA
ncbi:MAG: universal stress protein [Myxococcales bacterium]|nr:universal stress protein [Myxococcales bacterium]